MLFLFKCTIGFDKFYLIVDRHNYATFIYDDKIPFSHYSVHNFIRKHTCPQIFAVSACTYLLSMRLR